MSPAFSTRRRAEQFDALISGQALDTADSDHRSDHSTAHPAFDDLLVLVGDLRSMPQVSPRPDFSADLRERLMAEAETALSTLDPAEARLVMPVRSRSRDRRIATVVGGAALLGATTSMAVAAQTALPGDSLYPIKRALEEAQTGFANDDTARGSALLANAEGRLAELDALALRGTDEGIAAVPGTLVEFKAQSLEASDLLIESYETSGDDASIAELRDFTSASMDRLLELDAQLPESAHDELVDAARTLAQIDDRARALCPSCGTGITSVPPILLSSGGMSYDGVAPVSVPSAVPTKERVDRVGPREKRRPGKPKIAIPEVELGEGTSATGESGSDGGKDGRRGGSGAGGSGGGGETTVGGTDPVKELTKTLTQSGGKLTTKDGGPVGNVLEGVEDTLDDATGGGLLP